MCSSMFHEKEQQGFERASDGRDWQEPGETGGQGRWSGMCIETCRIGRDGLANEEGNLQKKKQQVQGP